MAQQKARHWWTRRMGPDMTPQTIDRALELATNLAVPAAVQVRRDGKYDRVVGYVWDDDAARMLG